MRGLTLGSAVLATSALDFLRHGAVVPSAERILWPNDFLFLGLTETAVTPAPCSLCQELDPALGRGLPGALCLGAQLADGLQR